ncbi:MAG TPA: hypothetical protein VJG83_01930 [archaeon]|nr:hypothetical protein [archaeon]
MRIPYPKFLAGKYPRLEAWWLEKHAKSMEREAKKIDTVSGRINVGPYFEAKGAPRNKDTWHNPNKVMKKRNLENQATALRQRAQNLRKKS